MISIIIPVYNRIEALKKALASIYAQTYKDIEIIIVDDGSEPCVELRIKNYELKIKKEIQIIFDRQENKGAPAARNRGFELSKGDYAIFWDADVIGKSDMLEKMLKALQNHPEASYAYCDFYIGRKKMRSSTFDADKLKINNYITTTSLIRRGHFPWFDESLKKFQDWDLWLTMLERGRIGIYVPGYLFKAIPCGTMSAWIPSFAYRAPWKWLPGVRGLVKNYCETRKVIMKKHGIRNT